ncbi:AbgT family transporter [Mycetocola spongiae]|uniref:AbgT family transporter n=1 Tax=Mycetocola spongiae TaxID=2859226 RepID=UPI001CF3FC3D|nr:AbgT family transporter [Mycetocola spongiae]UCR88068.1 AbgT family transporter [Mycetocola spongiae]
MVAELTREKFGRRLADSVLGGIERTGNKLPHPFFLFLYIFGIVAVVSTALALFNVAVTMPGTGEVIPVLGFFTSEGILWFLDNFVKNFIQFPPFGTVVMMLMAVGLAERSGLLGAAVTAMFARAPKRILPYAVALIACQGHIMSDVAMIVLPPLAALVFLKAGRNPLAGMIGTFSCVLAGYAGGMFVGVLDTLLLGITEQAVLILPMGAELELNLLMNYFFTAISGVILGFLGGYLIDRVLEPRLGTFVAPENFSIDEGDQLTTTPLQRRGLRAVLIALAGYFVLVIGAWVFPGSPLQGPGGTLVPSPLLSNMVPIIFGAFMLIGVVYGIAAKTFTRGTDVPKMMSESVATMSNYIVLIFVIAQMIALFKWSNLGTFLAVKSAAGLQSMNLTGFPAVVLFVLLIAVLSLVVTSGSALWALVAPVFVPAFMLLNYDPALTLAAYRIGDSVASPLSPLNPYLLVLLVAVQRYEPTAKLGTLLSRMAIFVLPFLVVWLALLAIFFFFDLPLGPGAGIHLN